MQRTMSSLLFATRYLTELGYDDKIVLLVDCLVKDEEIRDDNNFFDISDMFDD